MAIKAFQPGCEGVRHDFIHIQGNTFTEYCLHHLALLVRERSALSSRLTFRSGLLSGSIPWTILDFWHPVALQHDLSHPSPTESFIVMPASTGQVHRKIKGSSE